MVELEPNRGAFDEEEETENRYVINENNLGEGVEASNLNCKPKEDSGRFWECTLNTVNPQEPVRRHIMAPVDAVNVHTEDVKTETRATRGGAGFDSTSVTATEEGASFEVTGTCRPSSTSDRNTFCELKVEDGGM